MQINPPLPQPGGDFDVWGTILNAALTSIIQQTNGHDGTLGTLAAELSSIADSLVQASPTATPGTIVKRGGDGYFGVLDPINPEHAASKAWVEALTLLARERTESATSEVVPNAVVKRSANGYFNVASPSSDTHPANKSYVDSSITARGPFSSTTSTGSVASGGGFEDVTFTFPVGKFSAPPTVVASALHPSGNVSAQVVARSETSCTVRIRNNGASAITVSACVIAI